MGTSRIWTSERIINSVEPCFTRCRKLRYVATVISHMRAWKTMWCLVETFSFVLSLFLFLFFGWNLRNSVWNSGKFYWLHKRCTSSSRGRPWSRHKLPCNSLTNDHKSQEVDYQWFSTTLSHCRYVEAHSSTRWTVIHVPRFVLRETFVS